MPNNSSIFAPYKPKTKVIMKKRLTLILTALLMSMVCLQAQPTLKRRAAKAKTVSDVRALLKTKKVGSKASLRRAEGEPLQNVQSALPFEQLPDMNGERRNHQTFASANGFMVAGGHDSSLMPTGTAELYQNGSWKKVSMASTVDDPTFSVTLANGSVMIGGGYPAGAGSGHSKGTAIYNPSSQKFTAGPNMTVERMYCNGILINGNIYVSGNLGEEDLVYDRYDGTRFSAFGRAGEFSSPYLFADENGSPIAVAPYDNNRQMVKPIDFGDGDIYFCGIQYDVTEGKAYYYPFDFIENHLLELPGEMCTSDYCWSDANAYFLLTKNDAGKYRLGIFLPDFISYGYDYVWDDEFNVPTKSPTDNAAIIWRGGVFFNNNKEEAYLIGSSGSGTNWNVHIISYDIVEGNWTIATATGFDRDLTGASWALLSDGRLACSGGSGPNYSVSKKAYIFAPPPAGTESDPNQGTNPDNPDPDPAPNPYNPDPDPVPTGAMADSLVSNYGNWMNLTNGYSDWSSSGPQKMEVQLDGNFIHLIWMDGNTDADNATRIWYRRSTDSGKTWEDARVLTTTRFHSWGQIDGTNKLMCVNNGRIHFAVHDKEGEATMIRYIRSDDHGATFQEPVIVKKSDISAVAIRNSLIDSDGEMVVISTVQAEAVGYGAVIHPRFLVSKDHGQTFTELSISENNIDLFDLKVSNGHFATLGNRTSISYGLQRGEILITAYDGSDFITTQVAPIVKSSEKPHCTVKYNGANYHPQMAIEGNTIHLMYVGAPEDSESPLNDLNHTFYQKSTDFGKTWTSAYKLPESEGREGMIVAKGQNVYIVTNATGARHVVYYSHDSGKTWNIQDHPNWIIRGSQGYYNPNTYYSLSIAQDDPTGNHVYYTGCRFFFAETKDGFKTICKNSVLGTDAWVDTGNNNYGLMVLGDQNGQEHWFMQFTRPASVTREDGVVRGKDNFSRDICYRRPQAEPAPTKEAAMDLTLERTTSGNGYIDKRVVIPMTPSLQLTDAMTVETWVYVEEKMSFQIAANTDHSSHDGYTSYIGWYIDLKSSGSDWLTIVAGKENVELSNSHWSYWSYYKLEQKKWHHVALTYDAHLTENNFCLYIDGILVGCATSEGPIMSNNNPICLGNADRYGSKGMLDDFSIWSRALTQEEILSHIYKTPDGKDKDCRVLLTFNNTLRDESQYHNDALAQLDVNFVEHETINPPHTDFVMAKDQTGKNVTLSDATVDGKGVFWIWGTNSWNHSFDHNVKLTNMTPGNYFVKMIAASDNACVGATKQISIAGLTRVMPENAGQAEGVRLKVQGGFRVTYSNQPKVLLHKGNTDIEGKWLVERGYDSQNAKSLDDMPYALFDLSKAATGKYDVIVGTDTLKNAFEVKVGEEPNVWAQVNGPEHFLLNKPALFSIDYGNRSNVPAYNVPFFFCVPKKFGNVNVSLDFDVLNYSPYLDDEALEYAKQWNDYMPAVDENGDTICVYSFMIPYIGPNTTYQHTFHVAYHDNGQIVDNGNLKFYYVIEDPWGVIEDDASAARNSRRAKATLEQMECMVEKFAGMILEDGLIGQLPFVGCAYSASKTVVNGYGELIYGASEGWDGWINLGKNIFSTVLSCGADALGVGVIGKLGFFAGSICWSFLNAAWSRDECLNGDKKTKDTQGAYSWDPNEMIGPSGYDDDKHFIKPIHNMSYMVTYENKAEATAPANEVFIRDTLDVSKYDLSTFSFTGYGWADQNYSVGGSRTKEFTRDIPYKANGTDIIVRVSGQFDENTGVAAWSFVSLDKNGKELQDIMLGFLPPNNADGIGEGFVTFSVEHKANPANGSSVSNKATIVFDYNKPIVTNTYVNTFDTDYPSSSITKVEEKDGKLVVTLSGSDATSGIGTYHIFAFKNGGEAEQVTTVTQGNQATFTCEPGTKYGLCVIATDNVGWNEPKDIKAEIEVTTSGTGINNILIDNPSANDFIDLQGRRVKDPKAPGIYIQNKKKVVVK